MWRPPCPTNVGKALSSTPFHRDDRAGPASRMRGAPNFDAACVFAALHYDHDKIGTPTPRFAAASRSCDPDPAQSSARLCLKQTEGGSDEHSNRTHPGMARGAGQHPSGDRDTRDARGTPARLQTDPQAQATLGRVSARRGGAAAPLSSCLTRADAPMASSRNAARPAPSRSKARRARTITPALATSVFRRCGDDHRRAGRGDCN